MKYGICLLSLVPQRAEPSEKSEMVNQLLFGDVFTVLENQGGWLKIQCAYDDYEGWIDKKMATGIAEEVFQDSVKFTNLALPYLTALKSSKSNETILLTPGSYLTDVQEDSSGFLDDIEPKYGELMAQAEKKEFKKVVKQFLNVPYLWGGKSVFGIDCSGFVQVVFRIFERRLPRDASDQSTVGKTIGFIQEAKPGDLAYFDNEEGKITHVGILLDNQTIIHASGCVRIDKIDAHGIFNQQTKKYSHKLRIIKRIGNF